MVTLKGVWMFWSIYLLIYFFPPVETENVLVVPGYPGEENVKVNIKLNLNEGHMIHESLGLGDMANKKNNRFFH